MNKRIGWIAMGALLVLPVASASAQRIGRPGRPILVAVEDADNTGRNERDAAGTTLTPMDQGNSEQDRDITAQIRQAVVKRDDLSVNAKNAKIITQGGVVTLRGPVASAAEKATIDQLASNARGVKRVQNQLEIESGK